MLFQTRRLEKNLYFVKIGQFLSAWLVLGLAQVPFQKRSRFPLNIFTFRQKSTLFCIPALETPQPILPYPQTVQICKTCTVSSFKWQWQIFTSCWEKKLQEGRYMDWHLLTCLHFLCSWEWCKLSLSWCPIVRMVLLQENQNLEHLLIFCCTVVRLFDEIGKQNYQKS